MKDLIASNNITRTDEWLTPPELINALGPFDLDVASPSNPPWKIANKYYTFEDNGLMQPWIGRVWCNPPYSDIFHWLNLCAMHKNVLALVFARTETKAFQQYVFPYAYSIFFFNGRLSFYDIDGNKSDSNASASSVLISYDEYNSDKIQQAKLKGFHTRINKYASNK